MASIRKFQDIFAWKEARALASEVYAVSKKAPFSADFALGNQIQRAVISVSSNIAEGFDRGSDKAFVSFLYIARGSVREVQSQLYLALDFGYLSNDDFSKLQIRCESVASSINGFIQYLSKDGAHSCDIPCAHEDDPLPYDAHDPVEGAADPHED